MKMRVFKKSESRLRRILIEAQSGNSATEKKLNKVQKRINEGYRQFGAYNENDMLANRSVWEE